jgi:tetratricopeptide (TPR) repeat protein
MSPSTSEAPHAIALVTRREGHWDQSTAYFERALAVDPRNTDLLIDAASTYAMLRQFPAALKLCDRVLDITPSDPDVMASKARILQAQGNLQEAARCVSEINERTSPSSACESKIIQLRLERNYGVAVRLLKARLAQFHFGSTFEKACAQEWLVELQFLSGDTAGLKVTAEAARNALEKLCRDQPDNVDMAVYLSRVYAAMGEKDLALKEAERAVILEPRAKDVVDGPAWEENLALIQTIFGENSRAISTLTQLLQTPYESLGSVGISAPITLALLRLDPLWDPLRSDPAFQKLCEEKQP